MRPAGGRSSDRGSGTVLVLGVLAVLVLAGVTAAAVAAVGVARHRAAAVADLAALAAASRAAAGADGACAAATRNAAAAGGRVTRCVLDGPVVQVSVVVRPSGWLGTLGEASGRASAGPGQDSGPDP